MNQNKLDTIIELHCSALRQLLEQSATIHNSPTMPGLNLKIIGASETEAALEKIGKDFLQELNDPEIEKTYSDNERLDAYQTFRSRCAKIAEECNGNLLNSKVGE